MKMLTIAIPDDDFEKIETEARIHGVSVEQEAAEKLHYLFDWRKRPLIVDRDELLRRAEAFTNDLAARGICITNEEIQQAKLEGRE